MTWKHGPPLWCSIASTAGAAVVKRILKFTKELALEQCKALALAAWWQRSCTQTAISWEIAAYMDPQQLEYLNGLLDGDAEVREKIKEQVVELDKKTRSMVGSLNKIHSTPPDRVKALVESVRPSLYECQETTATLADIVPPDQFWRWKDMWSNSIRAAVFCAALMEYLTSGKLISLASVNNALGMKSEWKDRLALPAEDYLHGLITLVNELSRLAINSVTLGNFEEPIRISLFVKDLFAGFSMLNLKNDTLRRRFDSLKYDIKKIEEVVYDVSLRKLAPSGSDSKPQGSGNVLI